MQHEHCGFCGFMSLTKMATEGMKKCPRCNWEGYPERNTAEEINKISKGYRPGNKWAPPIKADYRRNDLDEIDNTPDNVGSIEGSEEENHEEQPVQQSLAPNPRSAPIPTAAPKQGSFRMSDDDAYKSENKIGDRTVSSKVPKNQELLNRLKGKNIKGADFL